MQLDDKVEQLQLDLNKSMSVIYLILEHLNLKLERQPEKLILKQQDEKTK